MYHHVLHNINSWSPSRSSHSCIRSGIGLTKLSLREEIRNVITRIDAAKHAHYAE